MSDELLPQIQAVYDAALRLWFDSGVEQHAEGHPGIAGARGDGEEWSASSGTLDGAITTLILICERKFLRPGVSICHFPTGPHPPKEIKFEEPWPPIGSLGEEGASGPDDIPPEFWKKCQYCHETHHPLAGCARPPEHDTTGRLSPPGP